MAQHWTIPSTDGSGRESLFVSLSAGTLTLGFAGHTNLTFDGEGRLVGAWYEKRTYRRALDNRIQAKWTDEHSPGERQRAFLSQEDAASILNRSYGDAARVLARLEAGSIDTDDSSEANIQLIWDWLACIAQWTLAALDQDAARFQSIYKPISILPPDQYLSTVLQATEGCSYNKCTFCTLYRDRQFYIKNAEEFERHIDDVCSFLGRSLYVRRTIFLADANAIVIPQAKLLPLLKVVNRRFNFAESGRTAEPALTLSPEQWTPSGINAFISAPDALHKDVDDLRELAVLNVHRLYVGLESGHDPLRNFLQKPGSTDDVLRAVSAMKQGGLHVGIIFMAGVGGKHFIHNHFTDTVDAINRMPLGPGDLVYISPFVASADSPYLDEMQRSGYSSLTEEELLAEAARFRNALLPMLRRKGVLISRYDIREFVY